MIGRRSLALVGFLLAFSLLTQEACANSQRSSLLNTRSTRIGSIELISKGSDGHGGGTYAAISASGRYVAFESPALDLLPGGISDSWDTYLHDQQAGRLERDSTTTGGRVVYNPGAYTSAPAVSADGRFVAFMSQSEKLAGNDGNNSPDIFVHDRQTDLTELISVSLTGKSGNDASYTPAISADGRFVVFQPFASDLVKGDPNNVMDVFIRDRQLGTTELVSMTGSGAQGSDPHDYGFPDVSVSNDGRYVAFAYQSLLMSGNPATGPNIYLCDRQSQTTMLLSTAPEGSPGNGESHFPAVSADGSQIAFTSLASNLVANDTNDQNDVFVYHRIAPVLGSGSFISYLPFISMP